MISIIVPAYNAEKCLEKCLESIRHQTFTKFEVILINDGSTDNTQYICEQFAIKDARIRVVHQSNSGISCTRNVGVSHCKQPYITFVDADDWIETTYLEVLFNNLTQYDADISICGHYIDDLEKSKITAPPKNDKIKEYSKSEALSLLFLDDYIKHYLWGKLYKRSLFDGIKFPKNTFYEDVYTTYKLFNKARKVVKTDEALLHYVKHGTNMTATNSGKKTLDAFNGFVEQLNFIRAHKGQLKNIKQIEFTMAKQFYRLKKSLILDFDLNSPLFLQHEQLLNSTMVDAIQPIRFFDVNPLFYLKYHASICYPKLFSKYLVLTRGN